MLLAAGGGPLDERPEAFNHVVERRRPQHLLNVRGLPEGTRRSRSVLQRRAVCSSKPAAKVQVWSSFAACLLQSECSASTCNLGTVPAEQNASGLQVPRHL